MMAVTVKCRTTQSLLLFTLPYEMYALLDWYRLYNEYDVSRMP